MGSNHVGASEFFWALFVTAPKGYFTTAIISFTSTLYLQFNHMVFISLRAVSVELSLRFKVQNTRNIYFLELLFCRAQQKRTGVLRKLIQLQHLWTLNPQK